MSSIRWQPSWEEAQTEAAASKRPILIDFWDPG